MNKAMVSGAAVVVGILPAFFLVFQSLFTDAGALGERLLSLLLIGLVYGLLGAMFGYLARSWQAGLWLGVPAAALVGLYTLRESQQILLHLLVLALTLAAGYGGARAGASAARRA